VNIYATLFFRMDMFLCTMVRTDGRGNRFQNMEAGDDGVNYVAFRTCGTCKNLPD